MKRLVLTLCALTSPALAAIGCPASDQGHALARADGASLYIGDPSNHMLLAPTKQARTMAESNVWILDEVQPITLVCQFEGTRRALARSIPAGTKQCVQNLSANSFDCK